MYFSRAHSARSNNETYVISCIQHKLNLKHTYLTWASFETYYFTSLNEFYELFYSSKHKSIVFFSFAYSKILCLSMHSILKSASFLAPMHIFFLFASALKITFRELFTSSIQKFLQTCRNLIIENYVSTIKHRAQFYTFVSFASECS